MKRKVNELDRETIFVLQFLDTPGDEVAPGSNEIGKDFQYKRLRHGDLLRLIVQKVPIVQVVQIVKAVQRSKFKDQRSNPSSCFRMFQWLKTFKSFQTLKDWKSATRDSRVVVGEMSKGKFACHEAVS